ncbi:MMPL family protein [Novipirellula galeiformis]|uniref:MMPL family protein n=1 Tax=Novipirellula galeiformis TaxID=2528004 RepID=A0A5C6CL10_9BACT|nr:MMPL family transporter [Novipirellula galeiformis]TWU24164.1 MMPL family protein [Novipirellula galeiformis]
MPAIDYRRRRYLRRLAIGVGLLLLLAIPAILHSHAAIESILNRPPDWVADSLPEKAEFNEFTDRFSAADIILVGWEGADLDSESLQSAAAFLQPLCQQVNVSLDEDRDPLPPWAEDSIAEIRKICGVERPLKWCRTGSNMMDQMMAAPANLPRRVAVARLRGSMVGEDGKQTCMVFSMDEAALVARRGVLPVIRQLIARSVQLEADMIAMVGGPFDGAAVDEASVRSVRYFAPPSAVFAAILCFIALRSIPLTAVITSVAVIGEGMVLAAVYYWGTPLNAVLIVLPPLVFVLTVSAGIHLSNYYLDAAHEHPELNRTGAAYRAMRAGMAPCLLATGTTVVGLGSLVLVRIEPIRVFGAIASLGVLSTLLMLLLVLPGAMVLTDPRTLSPDVEPTHTLFRRIRGRLRRMIRRRLSRPWPVIIGFVAITIGLGFGLRNLETSVNVPRMFLPDSDIRRQYEWFEKKIGPTVTGELLVSFPPISDDQDPLERLDLVKRVHMTALKQDSVDGVLSPLSFIPPVQSGSSLSATANRSVIRSLIRDPESSIGKLHFISRDEKAEVWRVSIRLPQNESVDHGEMIAQIRHAVQDEVANSELDAKVILTGHVAIVQKAQEVLLRDLFRSFLAAFGIVAIVMMFLLRSILGGLIAMVPNLFPTVALFGCMGLYGTPLDIGSVMTASVALGIAVDDTIHLVSRYGSRRARGLGQIRAVFGALSQCGWAMLQTTLVCGLSLMPYWFSSFVPTSQFAVLMMGLLLAALLGDVLLLPSLMASPLGRWLARPVGLDPKAAIAADMPIRKKPADTRRLPRPLRRRSRNR